MKNKTLLLSLIKDDLTNIRLVHGLEELGLDAGKYYLHLNETIFKLAGIKHDEEIFLDEYIDECHSVIYIDIFEHPEVLNNMALGLYHKLMQAGGKGSRFKILNLES